MTAVHSPQKDTAETLPPVEAPEQQKQHANTSRSSTQPQPQSQPQSQPQPHTQPHTHEKGQKNDQASVAESQVLEALTRLRSASADSPAPASLPASLPASAPASAPASPTTSTPPLPTSPTPTPTPATTATATATATASGSATATTISCAGSIPDSSTRWGCGERFPSAAQLQAHLDDVANKCIIPYTEWYLANHKGDIKSWQIVASAVDNITQSTNTTTDSFDNAAIDPAFAEPSNDDQSVNYWGTVMEKNIAAAAAAAAAAAVAAVATNNNGNTTPPSKITISDLVQATMKVEADEAAKSKRITKRSRNIRTEPTGAPINKRKRKDSNNDSVKILKSFTCEFCGKKFTRKSNLDSHLITHSSEKPHPCSQCGKPFARLSDRTRHESTTHGTSKIFQCRGRNSTNEWGCGHFYSRADGLRKHFKSAAGKLCLQAFLGNENLPNQDLSYSDQLQNVEAAIRNVREHCGW